MSLKTAQFDVRPVRLGADDRPASASIHPTALVSAGARIGSGVEIGPFCQVGAGVALGDGTRLLSHVVVDGETEIGRDCTVFPFATIGLPPQDMKYRGEPTRTVIGARTVVREHVTIHRGTVTGHGVTRVGSDCLLMAVVHVAHDCDVGDNVIIANNVVMGGHVTIGAEARIMGSAALHQFVRIGRGAVVGGVTGVERDVIPYGSVLGNRARLVGLNWVGLRRGGLAAAEMQRLRLALRTLFPRRPGAEAFAVRLEATRAAFGADPRVAEIIAFIDAGSRRGLVPAASWQDDDEAGLD